MCKNSSLLGTKILSLSIACITLSLTAKLINLYDKKVKKKKHSLHYEQLRDTWSAKHKEMQETVVEKHGKILTDILPKHHILGGMMLAATPFISAMPAAVSTVQVEHHSPQENNDLGMLIASLYQKLPDSVQPLDTNQETEISKILTENFGIPVAAELHGVRLNTTYGIIGQEQHLRRYPGDDTSQHVDTPEDHALFAPEGTAPGLGAWGYFADSKETMTYQEKEREKWYIAVQTFLSPGWDQHAGEYGIFFKYRKLLVVNPENGHAVVADIADAGPAPWTGKQLGGSPEVMHYLERVDGSARGGVLYFFVDDPRDTIPLGPIQIMDKKL